MRSMIALTFILVSIVSASAGPTYQDVIRTCGAEWRERTDKATNKGVEAWNTFRKECVARKGYVTKAEKRGQFDRVPDAK